MSKTINITTDEIIKGLDDDLLYFKGVLLDIGCGNNKQKNFLGMDKRDLPGVDIVHDLEIFPYPIPPCSCLTIKGSHIVEHIKPWLMLDFMNELWRIMKIGGQLALSMPYGVSRGFVQDPTHCNPCNEATWQYFNPEYGLWHIYKPKPWKFLDGTPVYQVSGNMEVLLEKIDYDKCENGNDDIEHSTDADSGSDSDIEAMNMGSIYRCPNCKSLNVKKNGEIAYSEHCWTCIDCDHSGLDSEFLDDTLEAIND